MIYFRILLSFGFIVLFGASAEAFYIHQGIHGMKWGASIADYHDLTKVHEKKPAAFYVKTSIRYHTADRQVARISYGFYRNQGIQAGLLLFTAGRQPQPGAVGATTGPSLWPGST
jgi:hypothetical protein